MCKYCEKRSENEILGKEFELQPTAGFHNDRHYSSWIMKNKADEKAGIMISTNGGNAVYIDILYCPMCRKEVVDMQIGTYIKLILQKKNMSQQQLADKLNVPRQNVSNIINGLTQVQAYRARKIEKALDLPKYSLVELVGFPTNDNDKRKLEELG